MSSLPSPYLAAKLHYMQAGEGAGFRTICMHLSQTNLIIHSTNAYVLGEGLGSAWGFQHESQFHTPRCPSLVCSSSGERQQEGGSYVSARLGVQSAVYQGGREVTSKQAQGRGHQRGAFRDAQASPSKQGEKSRSRKMAQHVQRHGERCRHGVFSNLQGVSCS